VLANNNPVYIIPQTMNIFVVDKDPKRSAQELCDKHVVKMILESAQMLCAVFPNGDAPYKRAFYNHPCTKWARESKENYKWLLDHANAMCGEYTRRYGKIHKSSDIIKWCGFNYDKLNLPSKGLTPFAQAMPEQYKNNCAVAAYRAYYNGEKAYFATWRTRKTPDWFVS
jgi:hypothetical protein|tara:strand:- start:1626 stop:2132 length:507 start_codon:yes stop_codon:yes gene_type:complete